MMANVSAPTFERPGDFRLHAVLLHQEKLRESEEALSTKQAEHAQLEGERFTPTPSPVPSPAQSDDGGEKGEANDDEEGASDVPLEHTSNDVGVAGDAARPVAGIAKKRRCFGSVDVLQEVVEREIESISMEDAMRFQAWFARRAQQAKDTDEGTLEILRLQEEKEAYDRDSVLQPSQG